MNKIEIRTRDGLCPAYVYRPEGSGPWLAMTKLFNTMLKDSR